MIAADAKRDRSRRQIARDFGIHPRTVRLWCGALPESKRARQNLERHRSKVQEMHWEGYTYHYIARVTGIPVSTVWDYVNRPYHEELI